jgi:20S proteasome subunit beta 5
MLHGTTTLSFVFQGGIVVAVDSRATQGTYIGTTSISILGAV